MHLRIAVNSNKSKYKVLFLSRKTKLREKNYCLRVTDLLIGDSEYKHWFITQRSEHSHIADIKSQINLLVTVEGGMLGSENKLCQFKRCQENHAFMRACDAHTHTHTCISHVGKHTTSSYNLKQRESVQWIGRQMTDFKYVACKCCQIRFQIFILIHSNPVIHRLMYLV